MIGVRCLGRSVCSDVCIPCDIMCGYLSAWRQGWGYSTFAVRFEESSIVLEMIQSSTSGNFGIVVLLISKPP